MSRDEWSYEENVERIANAMEEIVAFMQTIARDVDRSAGALEGLLDRTTAHYDLIEPKEES